MRKIIRYKNRKLYDLSVSQYVTVNDLIRFVFKEGQSIQVVKYQTEEDITIETLSLGVLRKEVDVNTFAKYVNEYRKDTCHE